MPQPGHQVMPISLSGHSGYCDSNEGLVTASAMMAATQNINSKLFRKNLIKLV